MGTELAKIWGFDPALKRHTPKSEWDPATYWPGAPGQPDGLGDQSFWEYGEPGLQPQAQAGASPFQRNGFGASRRTGRPGGRPELPPGAATELRLGVLAAARDEAGEHRPARRLADRVVAQVEAPADPVGVFVSEPCLVSGRWSSTRRASVGSGAARRRSTASGIETDRCRAVEGQPVAVLAPLVDEAAVLDGRVGHRRPDRDRVGVVGLGQDDALVLVPGRSREVARRAAAPARSAAA